ncbi:MAG: ankyrin repeat domain-containing protein, partial [Cyclobacteriaceae bacterium]
MNIRLILLCILVSSQLKGIAQDIHRTACDGNLARLDSMLQYEDLHVPDDQGRTLLHWAVGCDQMEVFDDLIKRGIQINKADKEGYTPLYVALQFKRDSLLEKLLMLLEGEAWKSQQGALLLERAILDRNLPYVQMLIENGVDIEIINNRGSTPLEISKRIGAQEISKWLIAKGADESKVRSFRMKGEYMGLTVPGPERKIYAPNFISTEAHEFGSVFSDDGQEFYYAVEKDNGPVIRYSALIDGEWSQPETILSHEKYGYNDPFLSPDESRLYFISKRTLDGMDAKGDHDIWYVEKKEEGWSEPINAGSNINSDDNEYYISFTATGTMYFASNVNAPEERKRYDQDIYYSAYKNGEFQEAVRLGDSINTENYEADVFIAPDESYLIFCSTRPEGLGRGDLYISFRKADHSWTRAVNMGETVNTEHHELCPFVTADGKYILYTSNQDIYWISTEIIDQL